MSTQIIEREKTETAMVLDCARSETHVAHTPICEGFEPVSRKLPARDFEFLIERLSRPRKPNAALRAAARKYWDQV